MISKVMAFRLVAALVVLIVLHTVIGSVSTTSAVSPAPVPPRALPPSASGSFDRDRVGFLAVTEARAGENRPAVTRASTESNAALATQARVAADLITAERLSIRFQGLVELTGDYRIGADHMISIPVIGRISLEGLSAAELERTLSQKTASISGREAFVTVEIAEYKPVFVTGVVQRPGTAPWKPGMTVLHALTIAGSSSNVGRGDGTTATSTVSPEIEQFRLRRAVLDQKRNLAMQARLISERKGIAVIELPEKLLQLVGAREAQRLIDEQAELMSSRNQSVANQKAALERAIATGRQEYAGLQTQAANIRQQMDLRRGQKEKLDGLATKGWTRTDRVLDEQIRIIDLEEKGINVSVAMARVQGVLSTLERDRANLIDDRRAQIDGELIRLERDVAQTEVEIEQIRYTYRLATGMEIDLNASAPVLGERPQIGFQYSIVRQQPDGLETIKVDQFTRVNPGDIVVVGMAS